MFCVWGKAPVTGSASCPSLREKAVLLVKLSQHVEKRFPDDTELNAQFLELVYYVYRFIAADLLLWWDDDDDGDDDDDVVVVLWWWWWPIMIVMTTMIMTTFKTECSSMDLSVMSTDLHQLLVVSTMMMIVIMMMADTWSYVSLIGFNLYWL